MSSSTGSAGPPNKRLKQVQLSFFLPVAVASASSSISGPTPPPTSTFSGLPTPPPTSTVSRLCDPPRASLADRPSSSSGASVSFNPNQPSISYKRDTNNRSFKEGWFNRWNWLDWSDSLERVLCFPCRMVTGQLGERLFSKNSESAFLKTGFCNWKDATRCFEKHEQSACHAEAVGKWSAYCRGVNVASQISFHHSDNQKQSQAMLLKLLSTVRFLCRQGLALRGHTSDSGNFATLLKLRCEDDSVLRQWLEQKKSFVSHDIQNEYLELMAHHITRGLLNRIRAAKYFSIIADEVTDQTRQHQLGISIRWVDELFVVHEDFLGLYLLPKDDAETITRLIKDCLLRSSLLITNCRGQCYDGASVMAGHVSGVSKRIAEEEPRAVFVHCMAHSLNLALQESARQWPIYRDMLDYLKDIINLIRASPKRSAILADLQIQSDEFSGKSLRPLCPTRWTTRQESIHSLLVNYKFVQEALIEIADSDKSDAGTKANGLANSMDTFVFYFALVTGLLIFERTEQLSKLLQSSSISVSAALRAAEHARANLQSYRDDVSWKSMWASCISNASRLDVDPPTMPRVRRPPRRIDEGALPCTQTIEEYFRVVFFQFLDNIIETMNERLNQQCLQLYATVEDIIISSANNATTSPETDGCITTICNHFGSDLDERKLRLNLQMLHDLMPEGKVTERLSDITDQIKSLGPAQRLYAEVSKLIILLLVIPASSATAERSFSCLRRLKTYLRSTMGQERLNHILLLNVHQDETDLIDLKSVARDFISLNDVRRNVFGHIQ